MTKIQRLQKKVSAIEKRVAKLKARKEKMAAKLEAGKKKILDKCSKISATMTDLVADKKITAAEKVSILSALKKATTW